MQSQVFQSSSFYSKINDDNPVTYEEHLEYNSDGDNMRGQYYRKENDNPPFRTTFRSLDELATLLLREQEKQQQLLPSEIPLLANDSSSTIKEYDSVLSPKSNVSDQSGGVLEIHRNNLCSIPTNTLYYKGGTVKRENPVEKGNPKNIILNKNLVRNFY